MYNQPFRNVFWFAVNEFMYVSKQSFIKSTEKCRYENICEQTLNVILPDKNAEQCIGHFLTVSCNLVKTHHMWGLPHFLKTSTMLIIFRNLLYVEVYFRLKITDTPPNFLLESMFSSNRWAT